MKNIRKNNNEKITQNFSFNVVLIFFDFSSFGAKYSLGRTLVGPPYVQVTGNPSNASGNHSRNDRESVPVFKT